MFLFVRLPVARHALLHWAFVGDASGMYCAPAPSTHPEPAASSARGLDRPRAGLAGRQETGNGIQRNSRTPAPHRAADAVPFVAARCGSAPRRSRRKQSIMLTVSSVGIAPRISSPGRSQVHVTLLEWSHESLLVRWVESGRLHYGEQKWRRAVARRDGRCAYSGRAIVQGEAVFRPTGRPRPANHLAMIAADAVALLDA
ncbi:DUF3331 domain-containing protein [Burkholderia sp. BCC1998]|uniref:DUF3331 domain-containing protein n=1 Tax=Burkholderia sp. BCC1998 TaxID=2817447 RepID=UPI002AB71910|nr:DUF3331 domain-containing protein [Burkholderia sp. BCC1998]